MSKVLLVGLFALTFAGLTLGCSPEVPANPTYTKDVKAIFDAHCVRCHGANDTLVSMPVAASDHPPKYCYFQRYESEGDCSSLSNPDCKSGAGSAYCAGMSLTYVSLPTDSALHMPPLPSQSLNDWEMEVLMRWSKAGFPN